MSESPNGQPSAVVAAPLVVQQQPPPASYQTAYPENLTPDRVLNAMEYVHGMAAMYMPKLAVDHLGNLQAERVKPSQAEEAVRAAACRLLVRYFDGMMNYDATEHALMDRVQVEVTRRRPGFVSLCSACDGIGSVSGRGKEKHLALVCDTCDGRGRILVLPHGPQKHQPDEGC